MYLCVFHGLALSSLSMRERSEARMRAAALRMWVMGTEIKKRINRRRVENKELFFFVRVFLFSMSFEKRLAD